MKISLALVLVTVLFSIVVVSQTGSLAIANPSWRPWEHEISYPTIDLASPVEGGSYPSNDVWLNFTISKPSDWLNKTDCYISYVTYCVDGSATGPYGHISDGSDENETIIQVQDPQGVANPPTSFSFSFDLEGLTTGNHTLEILAEGNYDWTGFGYTFPRTSFTVNTSFPTPSPKTTPTSILEPTTEAEPISTLVTASASIVAIVGVCLLVYLKKRHR